MKAKLIATYGLPARTEPVYSFHGQTAHANPQKIQEEVWVEIPGSLNPRYNADTDEISITVSGSDYSLAELVGNHGWEPCVMVPTFPYRKLANMANDIILTRAVAPEAV